jgi:hypothetical protein
MALDVDPNFEHYSESLLTEFSVIWLSSPGNTIEQVKYDIYILILIIAELVNHIYMDEINQDAHWNKNLYFKTSSYAANYLLSISLQATLITTRNWYKPVLTKIYS